MQMPLGLIQNFSLAGLIKISSEHHLSFLLCDFSLPERKAQHSTQYLLHVSSAFVSLGKA